MTSAAATLERYADWLARPKATVAADLESFAALLLKWNRAQNLVSRETVDQLWPRHIADSLQLLPHLRSTDRIVIDLGSGGGFPAIPLAIASARDVILVEPIRKKAAFLRAVARELRLPVTVEDRRIEQIAPSDLPPPDLITSRALASLGTLCAYAAPLFRPQTRAIFHKGREHVDELAESGAVWHYDVLIHPSATDPSGVLLELSNLRLK